MIKKIKWFFRNLWFFRRELWEFRDYDYMHNLLLLARSLEATKKDILLHDTSGQAAVDKITAINEAVIIIRKLDEYLEEPAGTGRWKRLFHILAGSNTIPGPGMYRWWT